MNSSPLVLLLAALLFGVYVLDTSVLWINQFVVQELNVVAPSKTFPVEQTPKSTVKSVHVLPAVEIEVNGPSGVAAGRTEDESCQLEWLDPWHPMLSEQIRRDSQPEPPCTPKAKIRTQLKWRQLRLIDELAEDEKCEFRCIFVVKDRVEGGPWSSLQSHGQNYPQCDVVEVWCGNSAQETYRFLHTQVYEKPQPLNTNLQELHQIPDIHIIVLDSVSMSHAQRALPTTLQFFENKLEGQIFKHLNKVGLNSMPNYYPMLQGVAVGGERLIPWQPGRVVDEGPKLFCDLPGQPSTFLLAELKRRNYTTMYNEDWTCKFFIPQRCPEPAIIPVDHFFGSYFQRKYQIWPDLEVKIRTRPKGFVCHEHTNKWPKFCLKKHQEMLQHLDQYVKSYRHQPKASLSWFTYLAHDNKSELYQADQDFRLFFIRNQKYLENSFVFLMGDHGSRLYDSTSVPVDRREDNNPLLAVSLPKRVRGESRLMRRMAANKRELVTQYDMYSTFMDIADNFRTLNSPTFDSNESGAYESATKRGSSLFRPLPQPRNCRTLSIPFEFCNCVVPTQPLNERRGLSVQLAKMAVRRMNRELQGNPVLESYCTPLVVDERRNAPVVERLLTHDANRTVYAFTFHTLPGDGLYQGFATETSSGELEVVTSQFPRLNAYADQADCLTDVKVDRFFQNYCYCRDLLSR